MELSQRTFHGYIKRTWWLWFLAAAFIWMVFARQAEVEAILDTFQQAQPGWLILAFLAQGGAFLAWSTLYQHVLRMVDIDARPFRMIGLVYASLFVNTLTPSAGSAGTALIVKSLNDSGHTTARATAATMLALVAWNIAFAVVLISGLIVLFLRHVLQVYEIIAAGVMLGIIGVFVGALTIALYRPQTLARVLTGIERFIMWIGNVLSRESLLDEGWAEQQTHDFHQAALLMAERPNSVVRALFIALGIHGGYIVSLTAIIRAFRQTLDAGGIVAGYAISTLLTTVVPTPQGVGVVEGLIPVVFNSLGVPTSSATVIILAYRGVAVWLPVTIGALTIHRVTHQA